MDTIMFGFMAVASFTAVVANDQAWLDIDPNLLGLALTMLIQLSGLFQYGVRQSAEVVNQMVAVDRVLGYHDLPSEAAVTARYDDEVSTEWPQKGAISVRGLNVRYRPGLPLSLRSLTFEIPGGSRVGVVGRTGCGKSTLVQSLIRLLEAEDGQIFIDSVVSGCCADMLSHFESRLAPTVFVSSFASIAGHIQTWSLQAP
jgi:ATP-binding cassette subfamily C (CFTR/MRP) protein 4